MQIGGVATDRNGWDDGDIEDFIEQFTEVQITLESIDSQQLTIINGLSLIETDTTELQETQAQQHDFNLYLILLLTIYFGYHISHYFIPSYRQILGKK